MRRTNPPSTKPDYRVHVLHKQTRVTARIGSAWRKDDGASIGIQLDPFIVLDNSDDQLIITLFEEDG